MRILFKYFLCLHFFLSIGFFSVKSMAAGPFLQNKAFLQSSNVVTVASFKAWVENIKKKLSSSSTKRNKTNKKRLLKQINQQLQAMKIDNTPKALLKADTPNKQNRFLLPFQLASFKELFPLLFLIVKKRNTKKDCIYLKQKMVYDLYPNYEDTENVKLPYAHKELKKILQIICT